VKAWKLEPAGGSDAGPSYNDEMPPDINYNDSKDDLPF